MNGSKKLLVPEFIWEATLDIFEPYSKAGLEAGCIWYGIRSDDSSLTTMIGVPSQENHPRYFNIDSDSLAELTEAISMFNLVAVAQVHIHPGRDVEHSPWDDQMIISKRIHSLVIPHYGKRPCNISDVGVHRFLNNKWNIFSLTDDEANIQIIPNLVDTR